MALSIYIFALITLVVGLCFGWAWGAAAMAAALRARSQSLYQSQLQAESAGYVDLLSWQPCKCTKALSATTSQKIHQFNVCTQHLYHLTVC